MKPGCAKLNYFAVAKQNTKQKQKNNRANVSKWNEQIEIRP